MKQSRSKNGAAAANNERPWRAIGAAICFVLGVMFVLGVTVLDAGRSPRLYLLYWLVMFALIVWLCALAVKDVLHTRRLVLRWRDEQQRERLHLLKSCLPPGESEESA